MRVLSSALLSGLLLAAGYSSAVAETLGHLPPNVVSYDEILLTLPAVGLKRARVLVASPSGYRIIPMSRVAGDAKFKVAVTFGELAIMKYRFQAETESGSFLESDFFSLSEPVGPEAKEKLEILSAKSQALNARIIQLKNAIAGIEQSDPNELAKRSNKELAKALLVLSEREKERDAIAAKPQEELVSE
jgi:hypothetical protein